MDTTARYRYWSPPEWARNGFPLPAPNAEVVTMEFVVMTLHALADEATDADTTPLGAVLHVAHLLKTMQGADGRWPDTFNARTGEAIGEGRTFAPVPLFRRLNAMLYSTEFERACEYAEAAGFLQE
jgi:hypothetical protein